MVDTCHYTRTRSSGARLASRSSAVGSPGRRTIEPDRTAGGFPGGARRGPAQQNAKRRRERRTRTHRHSRLGPPARGSFVFLAPCATFAFSVENTRALAF